MLRWGPDDTLPGPYASQRCGELDNGERWRSQGESSRERAEVGDDSFGAVGGRARLSDVAPLREM